MIDWKTVKEGVMKRAIVVALVTLVSTGLSTAVWADAPNLLTYQGRLVEGTPPAPVTGNRTVELFLCTDQAGTSCVSTFTGGQLTAVTNGLFRSTFTVPASQMANLLSGTLYLKVSLNGTALAPLERLTSSPYAVVAGTASVLAAPAGQSVVIANQALFSGDALFGASDQVFIAAGGKVRAQAGSLNLGSGGIDQRLVIDSGGNVGISSASPSGLLTVGAGNPPVLQVLANGNIGVGISTPSYRVQVQTGINQYGFVQSNGAISVGTYLNGSYNSGMIGTLSNHPFQIYTSNSGPALTVTAGGTASGSVGIGTASPAYRLDVAGDVRSTGTFYGNGAGLTGVQATALGPQLAASTFTAQGTNPGVAFTTSVFVIAGNVGIGTSSPTSALHLLANSPSALLQHASNSGASTLNLQGTGGNLDVLQIARYGSAYGGTTAGGISLNNLSVIQTGSLAGPLLLQVVTSNPMYFATNNTERMRIDPNGNVGIGTTSPQKGLHVMGNAIIESNNPLRYDDGLVIYRPVTTPLGYAGIAWRTGSYSNALLPDPSDVSTLWLGYRGDPPGAPNNLYMIGPGINNTGTAIQASRPEAVFELRRDDFNKFEFYVPANFGQNVGIGVSNPTARLAVQGNSGTIGPLFVSTAAQGGSANLVVAANGSVGISTAQPVGLLMVGGGALTVSTNGSVGVGTANPAQVPGAGRYLTLFSGGNAAASLELWGGATGVSAVQSKIDFLNRSSLPVNPDVNTARIEVTNTAASTIQGHLLFYTRDATTLAERMRILSTGNVGIGTGAPGARLHVVGGDVVVGSDAVNSPNTRIGAGTLQARSGTAASVLGLNPSGGNVGIGEATPASLLVVRSTLPINVGISMDPSAANFGAIAFNRDVKGGSLYNNSLGTYGAYQLSAYSDRLQFEVYDAAGAVHTGNALVVAGIGAGGYAGNVGIGTNTPTAKLEVSGGIKATGTGGNVPHACRVLTATGGAPAATCGVGEIVVGGGGSCTSPAVLRETRPSGNGWAATCDQTFPSNAAYAICCLQ